MKRLLFLLPLALLIMAPGPQVGGWGFGGNPRATGISYAFFEFAPLSGVGLPYAQALCDQLAADEKTGNWWCINGDGTMASGSTRTLSPAGSPVPTTSTDTVCPSGPSCSTVTSQRFAAGGGYADSASTTAPNAFTACLVFSPDSLANINFFGKVGTSAATTQWLFQQQTSGRVDFGVSNGTTFSLYAQGPASSLAIAGGVHVACARYVYSGTPGASSTAQMCFDGTCGTASAVAIGPLNTASIATRIGFDTTYIYTGRVFGAFVTDADLGTTRIAAIAHAVLADAPTGAKGEAVTLTRSTPQGCIDEDAGVGSIVPANRLCVVQGGTTAAQGTFAQNTVRTEEFTNASWRQAGTRILSADKGVSPVGTLTADRMWVAACPTVGTLNGAFIAAANATNQTVSAFFKGCIALSDGGCVQEALTSAGDGGYLYADGGAAVGVDGGNGTGSIGIYSYSATGATGTAKACSYTPAAWSRCSLTTALVYGSEMGVGCVNVATASGSSDTGVADVLAWGANDTNTSALRPYIPATTAAVTTGAETAYLTLTSAPTLNSIEATVDTPAAYATAAKVVELYKDANNHLDVYVATASGNKLACNYVVGGVSYEGLSTGSVSASASHRLSCSYDGTNVIACVDGVCNSTAKAFTNFSAATRVYLGTADTTGAEINPTPILKAVRADPNPGRFR